MSTLRNTGSQQPSRRRHIARVVSALGTAALVGGLSLLAACADPATGPANHPGGGSPSASLTGLLTESQGTVRVAALRRDVPLPQTLTRSFRINGASGGAIQWSEVGLKVVIPPLAFIGTETITVTALAGDVVAYDFGPDGSRFLLPLTVTQNLRGTNYYKAASGSQIRGAYFKSASQIDNSSGTAEVDEFQPSEFDANNVQLKFKVSHFSGYMVSMD